MKTIKFKNNFPKMHGQKTAKLVDVHTTYSIQIPDELLEYDTLQSDGTAFSFGGDNVAVMILYFVGDKNILFTTIRKYNADNLHYINEIGETFNLEVLQNDDSTGSSEAAKEN